MTMEKECVAMLLAGGEGKRLGKLTDQQAKPAVYFGGNYRIIDFPLSNCANSGMDTVGVLTQYAPLTLNAHLGIGSPWELDRSQGGLTCLPPFTEKHGGSWYRGTADAIYQNLHFLEQFNPHYVLILSGDHIYKMDYRKMLAFHQERQAEVTISVIEVPWEETSRFGIMKTSETGEISQFEEKPLHSSSNLASMGVYLFNWSLLRTYLTRDAASPTSSHDFGKDVIPALLADQRRLFAYPFTGYWKDVGTIESYWQANMDLLDNDPPFSLHQPDWPIYSVNPNQPPHYLAPSAKVTDSFINEGCIIKGRIKRSILFHQVEIQEGSSVTESILMPRVTLGKHVTLNRVIVTEGVTIPDHTTLQSPNGDILVISSDEDLTKQKQFSMMLQQKIL
ncbi:glucose-1-phosphate adenylyltransferase [Alkalihalobacillus oceani]|uniref:Glucose-1-phosphate adenylyltransferase n=2 Tax=Halalkalibacter oceani TaxID=1653776 RepID=A0A9X2DKW7_9BACI|nr:glucose-1-phosphate adenylyltransferase [Halalkalibacter oceani]